MNNFNKICFSYNHLSRKDLVNSLLDDQNYHIEFNGHLTNHNKHAVIALNGLGASIERMKAYYEAYAICTPYGYGLEKPKMSKQIINQYNWELYLGKRISFSSYCDFFNQQEKELGMAQLLRLYVPKLLAGWAGAFTHATIHLGWALDVNHRWMIIEGLAYMAFSYVSCQPELSFSDIVDSYFNESPLNSLFYIADMWEKNIFQFNSWLEDLMKEEPHISENRIHPELVRSGLQYKIAKILESHSIIHSIPMWIYSMDIAVIWEKLHYMVTLLYLTEPGNFVVLHLITSLHAMENIAMHLPILYQRYAVKCFWIGMLAVLFSQGKFPQKAMLESLNLQYKNNVDIDEDVFEQPTWSQIVKQALLEEEEHNPKLVYVLQRMWKTSNYLSIFRVAASHFTKTPNLPKSFEMVIAE